MAERKPIFMSAEGWSEEMAVSDSMTLGGLTMGGNIAMGSNKITGMAAATSSGDALAYGQSGASLAGLTLSADLAMSGFGISGLQSVPGGANYAASKSYVDSLVGGISWKDPVSVLRLIGNLAVAAINALSPSAGQAYVVTDSGTLTAGSLAVAAGDLVEFDGSAWVLLEAGVGGFVAAGTRAILADTDTLISPYTDGTDNDKIVVFSGSSNTGTDTGDTVDKAAVLIQNNSHNGYYENEGYTYEGSAPPGHWVLFTGAGTINAGLGLTKSGNTLDVGKGDGISLGADTVNVDLDTNSGLALNGTSPNKKLAWAPDTSRGLAKDASGAYIALATNPGLQFTTGLLDTLLNSSGGLQKDASGLAAKLNGTTLQVGASGLSVKGLPLQFEVNAVAVNNTVTAAALNALTGGPSSDADAYHTHPAISPTEAQRIENTIAVAEAVAVADPVYWDGTNDRVGKSTANNNTKSRVMGIARTAQSTIGDTSEVVSHGVAVGVLSGATVGTPYYLQATGGISDAVPGAGNRVIMVGYAKNATDLWVQVIDYGKKAA